MPATQKRILVMENLLEQIELPVYAYQRAKARYEDLGEFFGRDQSSCRDYDPHVFPQGSFRLGTAIRPVSGTEEYDLDLALGLRRGISCESHTQWQLKRLVGTEIHAFRQARSIENPVKEKHRCWRLNYKDDMSFHMDIVPCIPAPDPQRQGLAEAMTRRGGNPLDSVDLANRSVNITDNRLPHFRTINPNWQVSNPEGFALWFESCMNRTAAVLGEKRAQVDNLPVYERKTPLQRVVQLLKRHRDQMYAEDQDRKPISIIITTLSAASYSGENTIVAALENVVAGLCRFADSGANVIPNPVNPEENFADRWATPEGQELKLQDNFRHWAYMARSNFNTILTNEDANLLAEVVDQRLCIRTSAASITSLLGLPAGPAIHIGESHEIAHDSARPWDFRGEED